MRHEAWLLRDNGHLDEYQIFRKPMLGITNTCLRMVTFLLGENDVDVVRLHGDSLGHFDDRHAGRLR
jgi:hypothetical protein